MDLWRLGWVIELTVFAKGTVLAEVTKVLGFLFRDYTEWGPADTAEVRLTFWPFAFDEIAA